MAFYHHQILQGPRPHPLQIMVQTHPYHYQEGKRILF